MNLVFISLNIYIFAQMRENIVREEAIIFKKHRDTEIQKWKPFID